MPFARQGYIPRPPSTASTCPVMYDASSEAKKTTVAATSSGVPIRPRRIRCMAMSTKNDPISLLTVNSIFLLKFGISGLFLKRRLLLYSIVQIN